MKVGRPTKYGKTILDKANTYLETYHDKENSRDNEPVPTIAGLSLFIGVSRETVYNWADQDEKGEFSDIVSHLMAKQEMGLMAGGIVGEFNASITKLALTKHGYSDKQDQNVVSDIQISVSQDDESVL